MKIYPVSLALAAVTLLVFGGCAATSAPENQTYTLYRNSLVEGISRVHVSTFDAVDGGEAYNRENCQLAEDLFQQQPGTETKFWCEKGRFRE